MDMQDWERATLLYKAASKTGKAVAHTVPVYAWNKMRPTSIQFSFGERTSRDHTLLRRFMLCLTIPSILPSAGRLIYHFDTPTDIVRLTDSSDLLYTVLYS
jgi:hypothetical protein